MTFFLEMDLTSGYITEIVARRGGDIQIDNCTMWPPKVHEFDTPGLLITRF